VHAELLARLRRVDTPDPPWWFGYARDGSNLSAMLMAWGAYVGFGFTTAVAFLAATLTTLTTYILDWSFARGLRLRHPRLALAVPLLVWVLVVIFWTEPLRQALERLIAAVQPVTPAV